VKMRLMTFLILLCLPLVMRVQAQEAAKKVETITFAGGCFWCMEKPFEAIEGVTQVLSGYMGGHLQNPSYHDVSSGRSGHREVVEVSYISSKVSVAKLLDVFWHNVNPTDAGGQFVDRGQQYSTAIFYTTEAQKTQAIKSKEELEKSGKFSDKIVTPILVATKFYPAEDYHQDYYKKNPIRYKFYRYNSGRDQYLEKVWGKSH